MLPFRRMLVLAACAASLGGADLPWYMQETAMTPEGRLTFLEKPWWPRARQLKEGESFTLDLNHDGRPDTLIQRKDGNVIEAIDDSGQAAGIWGGPDTAYVVSLNGTGVVDRLVAFIDNNRDGKPDEMEFRHYQDGYLRYAWFGENYDNDGVQIFELKNWSYAGGNAHNRFRGNSQIYLNKYDSETRKWVPLSECPFSFWDPDHDGRGEIVLRVSAAPLDSNTRADPDYANNYAYMWAPKATPLAETGNMNVRFSFNIDPQPRHDPLDKPHYNFGFTLVGAQPYQYPRMTYTNPRRRPPETVVRVDWNYGQQLGLTYPATQTGFSWDEGRGVWRWEGQFWIWERRYLPNTGGPTMRWNMRREYSGKSADRRQIYYSDVDRRYHLLGASEGWMEVGHLVNDRKDLEFRMFDSDGDGYFDTWEVFEGDNPAPSRVSRVLDPRARPASLSRQVLIADYNQKVLPSAIEEDQRLIAALKRFAGSPLAEAYEAEAGKAEMPERRRYCLDIARELYFLKARDALYTRDAAGPYPRLEASRKGYRIQTPGPLEGGYTLGDSLRYWSLATEIEKLVEAYGAGRFDEARQLLEGM